MNEAMPPRRTFSSDAPSPPGPLGTPGAPNGGVLSHNFEGWLNYHFTEAERADTLISGPFADRDGDGIGTLLEFALALDPNASDARDLHTPSAASGDEGWPVNRSRKR